MHETYSLHKDGGFANELNQLLRFHAQFMHETYSLHKDGGFANELNQFLRFHKNWRSSTMSVKADRTKLLLKLLIP